MKTFRFYLKKVTAIVLAATFFSFCSPKVEEKISLKDAYKDYFFIGTALNKSQILNKSTPSNKLLIEQFNSIVAENEMKWEKIHTELNDFNFTVADSFVAMGEKNKMFIIGHNLLWHQQLPPYVFIDSKGNTVSRDTLLSRLHYHIATIVGRYKGRINGYDVVNEALTEDGQLRKSKWLEIVGEDYIQKAFEYAHEADPNVELYYNDYNIEQPAKRTGAIKLIKNLKAKGIRIDGVGIQGHFHLDMPSLGAIDSSIVEFSQLGVKVMFTELDINVLPRPENLTGAEVSNTFELKKDMNPYSKGIPDSIQQKLTERYVDFFKIFIKHKGKVSRVTLWGIEDGQSWLNNWPIKGRTNYPLLFDRSYKAKPAVDAIIQLVKVVK